MRLHTLINFIKKPKAYINTRIQEGINEALGSINAYQSVERDLSDKDVFIVGFPKSGHTWMQHLVAALMLEANPMNVSDELVQEIVPDIYQRQYFKRYWDIGIFKSHELPNPQYQRVIYLIRDGRDAMVSYFHYLNKVEKRPIGFQELLEKEDIFPSKWHTHVGQWLKNPYQADILYLKYEDLLDKPIVCLQQVCDFLNIKRSHEVLLQINEGCNFENMKAKNQRWGWGHKIMRDNAFFRKGVKGDYQKEMTETQKKYFEQEAGTILKRLKY